MTNSRQDEIEKAAKERGYYHGSMLHLDDFIEGAKWADENPDNSSENINLNIKHRWLFQMECERLRQQLDDLRKENEELKKKIL